MGLEISPFSKHFRSFCVRKCVGMNQPTFTKLGGSPLFIGAVRLTRWL